MKKRHFEEENKITFWRDFISYLPILLATFLFVIAVEFTLNRFGIHIGIDNDNTVLTFVGILATFVVISNYAQVQQIRNDFKKETNKLNNLRNEIEEQLNLLKDEDNLLHKQIDEIKEEISQIPEKIKRENEREEILKKRFGY